VAENADVDVLVVGAGPTGLALAAQLAAFGVRFRVVDRSADRVHESRALAIQPRTLEVLEPFGMSRELVRRGNPAVRVVLHARSRAVPVRLFDGGRDTAYPFLLFLSQAITEQVLLAHLAERGVRVERRTALVGLRQDTSAVTCALRCDGAGESTVRARFVVGADGAHSTVRELAGIAFPGRDYPQSFLLADVEADGVEPGAAHVFLAERGILFFFPLLTPATWRVLATWDRAPDEPVTLAAVQRVVDAYGAPARVRDPAWLTTFRLHSRHAAALRAGRVFLAGDAAHIHSPAGAQGMNTGVQDAVNLGWKLALVGAGAAPPALLDTYEAERMPVARRVLAMTDRAFRVATSTGPLISTVRTRLVPRLVPAALAITPARAWAFRAVGELSLHYRHGPLTAGRLVPWQAGPGPGDRLPDAPLPGTTLHRAVADPGFHLLLCGPWRDDDLPALARHRRWLHIHRVGRDDGPGALADPSGRIARALGATGRADVVVLVRPDGYVAYRGGADLAPVRGYLDTWLPVGR
jgi:2-polyprenyl-6-methoxyphenol hydroxylase-like FAD-dependent oxidoreductase